MLQEDVPVQSELGGELQEERLARVHKGSCQFEHQTVEGQLPF